MNVYEIEVKVYRFRDVWRIVADSYESALARARSYAETVWPELGPPDDLEIFSIKKSLAITDGGLRD